MSETRTTDVKRIYEPDAALGGHREEVAVPKLAPARQAVAVAPSDGADLATTPTRALFVGGAGNLSLILADDTDPVTFNGVPAGTILPLAVKRVRNTGTTASTIVALY